MLLREHLEELTKEELLDWARSFELKNCSRLRKAMLIDKLLEYFCTEEVLRERMVCLTKDQMNLLRRACQTPQDLSIKDIVNGIQLYRYWLGGFEDPSDKFCVFEEIKETFRKIDDEAFKAEQFKKGWMMECVQFFANYYGIAPVEILYELYRLRVKRSSIEEMTDLLEEMPIDLVECCIFSMQQMGFDHWPKTDPLYSAIGLVVYFPIMDDNELSYLHDQQMDKPFYIPSAGQIEEISRLGYEESSLAYRKLESFLIKKMKMTCEKAAVWCVRVWADSHDGNAPEAIINVMSESDVKFENERQVDEVVDLVLNAYNNTRMIENRGYTPNELRKSYWKNK